MPDQTIECKDCGSDFTFTESDQTFYASKQFEPPKRCKTCRDEAKRQRALKGQR